MKREPGFYWVKYSGQWQPARWSDAMVWYVFNSNTPMADINFDEIGEKIEHT